ncbi:MAG: glycoside hydrolase domain-containing protein [Marmoricola sp.]
MSFAPSRRVIAGLVVLLVGATLVGPSVTTAVASGGALRQLSTSPRNPVTPGNFTGKAFDQCSAPSQHAMNAWRRSPYRGVGIYISGASRACSAQRHLTRTWVRTQLKHGWKLLPIHVGRQASCNGNVKRWHRISASAAHRYGRAQAQGRTEANTAAGAARRLGLTSGSTIFYDLEGFSTRSASCRNSSLRFLSAWTRQLRAHGYVPGVYSGATSGIRLLDRARWTGSPLALPQQIWVADWNGRANTHSSYLHARTWNNARVKQYRGGHTERHGGVSINIDSNYVDLRVHQAKAHRTKHRTKHGKKAKHHATKAKRHATRHQSTHRAKHTAKQPRWVYLPGNSTPETEHPVTDRLCTTRRLNLAAYLSTGVFRRVSLHSRLQCVLKQNGLYTHHVTGYWGRRTAYSVNNLQDRTHRLVRSTMSRGDWVSLLVKGHHQSWLKRGVRGADVVRLQRALHAAGVRGVYITGRYDRATTRAVRTYQHRVGTRTTGSVGRATWRYLAKGRV